MEKFIAKIKYYEQEIRVELPMNYTEFTNCLSTMLQIPKEMINKFKIYYINSSDNKEYIIDNSVNYIIFLKNVRNRNTEIINIELINNIDEQKEKNNGPYNILLEKQEEDEDGNDLLVNPYKESYCADEDIKQKNSGNISNNIEKDFESLEFSFLEEQKDNNKEENKININNKINNNINNNISMNRNINNINNEKNNNINKNINSYYGQNKLVDNQIRGVPISVNFNIECNFCKNNKMIGIVFYCKNCAIFFCSNCEKNVGIKHPHCYYKIRNKEQFQEISKMHNNHNNQIRNPYDNSNNRINNNTTNEEDVNPFKEILSEGSKIIENIRSTTYNSVIKLFNINNNSNNNNSNYNINQNFQRNNNLNNQNNMNNHNFIKSLVEKAKSQYNLNNINDDEIERALIITKGNIDKAVELIYSNKI